MNIYIQNKSAKESKVLKEVEEPLDPMVNKLFCWNVVLVDKYARLLDNMSFLAIKNYQTEYTIYVPYFDSTGEDFFKAIEKYIRVGLELLDVDKEVLDNYFKEAGEFKFGLMNNASLAQSIRLAAIESYILAFEKNTDKFNSQKEACEFVTRERNSRDHYLNHEVTYNQIMTDALTDLYARKQNGFKAYEVLVTLDVEDYQITRRLVVPADINFYEFHMLLQKAFAWSNYHWGEFDFYKKGHEEDDYWFYQSDLCLEESPNEFKEITYLMKDYKLSDLMENDYKDLIYTYDLGDDWKHKIEVLNIYDKYKGDAPYLLEAHYSTPPEDVGGVSGFKDYLKVINDPTHEEYEHYKAWGKNWKKNLSKKMRTPHKL